MKKYLLGNIQFMLIMALWLVTGVYGGAAIYVVAPLSMLLFRAKGMYAELLIGFFFILILSDSRQPALAFAQSFKNVYILILAFFFLVDKKDFEPLNRYYIRFIPFFLIALICILFSENYSISFQKTLSYFLLMLVVPNITSRLIREEGGDFLFKLVFFGVIILLAGFLLRSINPEVVTLEGRFTGLLGNPNGLGVFCFLFFMVYAMADYSYPKLFTRVQKLTIFALVLSSIILSGSRSGVFSFLIFFLFRYFYRVSPIIGFFIFVLLIIVYEYISLNLVSIIVSLGLEEYFRIETLEAGSGRVVAWRFAWEKIQDNLLIGKGFGYTEFLFRKNNDFLSLLGHQGNAHNSYLTFWLDTGFVGLFLYMGAFLSWFIGAVRKSYLAMPVMYAVLFSVNFESWLTASLNPFTIQLLIILTLLLYDFEKKEENIVPVQ